MKAEKQIKIARGTAFFLIFPLILAPGSLFSYDQLLKGGESVTWQFALSFMGFTYILMSPLFALCLIYAWSLKRRKQKTAVVCFGLLAIWMIMSSIYLLKTLPPDVPIVPYLVIPIVVVALLLQGILGLRKLQTAQSSA
ncbi:MAG: hypothetical protein ABSG22_00500 [Sedimentisphaerales bacterium]